MFKTSNLRTVSLTAVNNEGGRQVGPVVMKTSRLLSYEQHVGFTRLRLTEGASLDVRESTEEIDRQVRLAASPAIFSGPPRQ